MKVVVYFENVNPAYAEVVAKFANEELYIACLSALEKKAKKVNMVVTESIHEDELIGE